MAVVRIEVDFDVDLDDGVTSAGTARVELDDPSSDSPALLERAQGAMLRLLPQETKEAEPQTVLTLNNVRFTEVGRDILFGPAGGYDVKVTEKGQCQDWCPHDEAGHPPERCIRPLGHGHLHLGEDGCGWSDETGAVLPAECGEMLQFGDCDRRKGHPGPHSDSGQCRAHCPEPHSIYRKGQCQLREGHDDVHWANQGNCTWANPDRERHDDDEGEVADCA